MRIATRGIHQALITVAVALPLVTFGTASSPAGAIAPSRAICFGNKGEAGDVAIVNLTPVLASTGGDGQLVALQVAKTPPKAANVNFGPGTVDPNVAFTRVGANGSVCFVNSKHANVELIADHLGSIPGDAYQSAQPNGAPKRVLDTRSGKIIGPRQSRCFKVAGGPGGAAVVNLTPVEATGAGDGQLVSSDIKDNPPKAANVNFNRGTVDPNVAIAKIGKDNRVCFINSKHASVHLVADHLGTIKKNAYQPARKNGAPKRVLNTLKGAKIPPNGMRCFTVAGEPGDAAIVNLTPVAATAAGNGKLVSSKVKDDPPSSANVNFAPGTVDPNIAIAEIGYDGQVCFINSQHAAVHLLADHLGSIKRDYYESADRDGAPRRITDTRIVAEVVPVSTSGPRPVQPSNVAFACSYGSGLVNWQLMLGGLEIGRKKSVLIRYANDTQPNDGPDHVETTDADIFPGFTFMRIFNLDEPEARVWNTRMTIETYINTPSLHSSATFDITTNCVLGSLPSKIPGEPKLVNAPGDPSLTIRSDAE